MTLSKLNPVKKNQDIYGHSRNGLISKMLNIALLYGLGAQKEPIKAIPKKEIEDLFTQGIF